MRHLILPTITVLLFLIGCQTKPKVVDAKTGEPNSEQPKLTKPVARRIWVPDEIQENGTVLIEGHWKYQLEKNSVWSR